MNSLKDVRNDGVNGIYHLIKFIHDNDNKHLSVVKQNFDEISFWTLITFFSNNHDALFDKIPSYILKDLFEMSPLKKASSFFSFEDGSFFDYGVGIKTDSVLSYKEQFKLIRNCLAHQDFEFKNGLLIINTDASNYKAVIDIKWLEAVVLCSLSNQRGSFEKGMSDEIILCPNFDGVDITNGLLDILIKNNALEILEITLETNSRERVLRSIGAANYISDFGFDEVFSFVQSDIFGLLSHYDDKLSLDEIKIVRKEIIQKLNAKYQGAIKLKLLPVSKKDMLSNDISFDYDGSNKNKFSLMFSHYQMQKHPQKRNSISFKYLKEVLIKIKNDIPLSTVDKNYLQESYYLLFKSFGNLIFNIPFQEGISHFNVGKHLLEQYNKAMEIDHGYYKSVLVDEIKLINASLKDIQISKVKHPQSFSKIDSLYEERSELTNRLECLNNNEYSYNFLAKIRNAFTHGTLDIDGQVIHLYNHEPTRCYPKYNKKSNTWEEKIYDKNIRIFNIKMNFDIFMKIINYVCALNGIKIVTLPTNYKKGFNKK